MAEVLAAAQPDSSFGSSLRRNSSQSSLFLDQQMHAHTVTTHKDDYKSSYRIRGGRDAQSQRSSAPSSPGLGRIDFSNTASVLSTPSSSLSLDDGCACDDDPGFAFPNYDSSSSESEAMEDEEVDPDETLSELTRRRSTQSSSLKPASNRNQRSSLPSPLAHTNSTTLSSIADDTAVKPQPTRHVDYLSHNWKEEDIWSSWRHIVAKRGKLDNWQRLENASWRTWMKAQRQLNTINPDRLNWMKDHDVTWLYGPLQTGSSHIKKEDTSARRTLSRAESFLGKKPILKRRSVSEIMLARSLSTQSLMRQATDAIKAQEATTAGRPDIGGHVYQGMYSRPSPETSSSRTVPESPSPFTSTTSSGSETPDEGRHIHFNETVEQCIAITSDLDEGLNAVFEDDDEHSSDEEFLTMKTDRSMERKLSRNATPRGSFSEQGSKTIAMLPATTLKYRADTPETTPQSSVPGTLGLGSLRESSSQETLRPSRPSANFLVGDDDEDEPMDPQWRRRPTPRRDSSASSGLGSGSPHPSQFGLDLYRDDNDELQRAGMRRTPSGMFMPYDDSEEMQADGNGIVGRVVDTYNTARDIAHVIWNVGWRR